jgi:hypothetical protein
MNTQYRFKVPDGPRQRTVYSQGCPEYGKVWESYSFGIEPFKLNAKGKQVKAGKAIVRLVVHCGVTDARQEAIAAAQTITDLLNSGHEYLGPKTLHYDWSRNHINPAGYLRPAEQADG